MAKNEAKEGIIEKASVEKLKKDLDEVIQAGQPSKESTNAIFSLLSAYEMSNENTNGLEALKEMTPKPKPEFIKRVKDALKNQTNDQEQTAQERTLETMRGGQNAAGGGVVQGLSTANRQSVDQLNKGDQDTLTDQSLDGGNDGAYGSPLDGSSPEERAKVQEDENKKKEENDAENDIAAEAPPATPRIK